MKRTKKQRTDAAWYKRKKLDPKWIAKKRAGERQKYWNDPKKARAVRRRKYKKYKPKIIIGNLRWAKKHPDKVRAAKRRYTLKTVAKNLSKGLTADGKRRVSPERMVKILRKNYAVHLRNKERRLEEAKRKMGIKKLDWLRKKMVV